jgi:hypothetical protein
MNYRKFPGPAGVDPRAQGTPDKLVLSLLMEPAYWDKVFERLSGASCTVSLEPIEEEAYHTD